ncbi:FecR family protein [Abditibacterium utsteinense]|uniref:FecR family protein n=1 Tax=Abditibacterium utsteinense TaxID=1960156 RepID=A0A2S8SRM3_9BACT|nr:FecR domain-containing protein [Abditibacterium utsteinense]PQV63428.1 FecR family protein [Abditibacterium utsteinense]
MKNASHSASHFGLSSRRRNGFTLLQLLIVVGLLALLSAILIGQFGRGRASVRRVECDVHLKEISLAMETFRQETGHMPASLMELKDKGYVSLDTLRCPADPDLSAHSNDATYSSYSNYYVIREPQDSNNLPVAVCPFHEKEGAHGAQAFKGGYSKQFATRPASLASGFSSSVVITRPGDGVLKPSPSQRFELRGGDHIQANGGTATIQFTDGSTASLESGADLTVMQSYVNQQRGGALYTLVRQVAGKINYYVEPGNNFDVATPTATAGALGTKFTIEMKPSANVAATQLDTVLTVQLHAVALSTLDRTIEVSDTDQTPVAAHDPANKNKPRKPRKDEKTDDKEEKSGKGGK